MEPPTKKFDRSRISKNLGRPPFPEFPGALGDYDTPIGKSQFLALETTVTKRLSHGISFRGAYTYSKTMQSTGYLNGWPYQDPHLLHQIAPYDRTNVFTLTGVYSLPSLSAGSSWRNVAGAIVNHWTVSNILSAQSGQPQYLPGGFYYTSAHSWTPDGGPQTSQWIYNCNGAPLRCWQPIPQFGLANLTNRFGSLRQPQVPNLDLSVQRDFPIRESIRLQFRADAFNLTNTVLFGGPDTNPYDGPPVKQANGSYSGFGTIGPTQINFPRIVQLSLKLLF